MLSWIDKPGNGHLLRYLERKNNVILVQSENRKDKKIGIIGEKDGKGHEEFLEEVKLYVYGKMIEREVKVADLGNIHKEAYFSKAQGLGLKTVEKDAETLVVKGTVRKIRELQAEIYKGEVKDRKKEYPKYWDPEVPAEVITVPLKEISEENRMIEGVFNPFLMRF